MSNEIPRKFCNAGDSEHPVVVSTVGELKAALEEIPDDTVVGNPGEGRAVIVFNAAMYGEHLDLEDARDWDEWELDD